jgi:DNA repair photolyase
MFIGAFLLYKGVTIMITEKIISVKDYLTKSKLPASDYVINPYVGCPHACRYCYASFMKRFTGHTENWGSFIDIKLCNKKINTKLLEGKRLFLSSVTDCYNPYEEKYGLTRSILEQIKDVDCDVGISTKSKLIARDIDLLKQFKKLTVSMSINTLDENFKNDMDNASSIKDRLATLKLLHENGIYTVLFMSPIFPYITDFKAIIEASKEFIDEYWFENLNLRGDYKATILNYIRQNYIELYDEYRDIYIKNNKQYWIMLSEEIKSYCEKNNINYKNYFHHEELVKNKANQ